jgi:hypothetical protein
VRKIAPFASTTADNNRGFGTGVFLPKEHAEQEAAFVTCIVTEP